MDKAPQILSLVPYQVFPPDMGGQKGIALFNRYLAKHVNLYCVTTKANRNFSAEGYPIKNILSNSPVRYTNLLYFFKLRRIIRQEMVTHLIIEHPYYGWLGMLLKQFCRLKLVVHSHNIESLRFKSTGRWWWGILWHYEKFTHRQADHNFFIHAEDRSYAIANFKLAPDRCTVVTYGFERSAAPAKTDSNAAREIICRENNIPATEKILLFNGTLGYKPNLDALDIILNRINPKLLAEKSFKYKIIICGSKLPAHYQQLEKYKDSNIIYTGFVEDINQYFKAADIFINPVVDGGGIKTKVVEALGFNLSVVSTQSGAIGIPQEITGGKLQIVVDNDWDQFCQQIITINTAATIPASFFEHFYWDNIARKAASKIHSY